MFGYRFDEARIGRIVPQRAAQRPNALRQRFVGHRDALPDLIHKGIFRDQLTLPFDKKRLASLLGMTPENLSRAFKTLQNYNIGVDGARITIRDQADIERFAKPTSLIDDHHS